MSPRETPIELPVDRPLEDDELLPLLAEAIINDHSNPGSDLPFQVSELVARLGYYQTEEGAKFLSANGGREAVDFKVAQLCWQMVTAGHLLPKGWAIFAVTPSGRQFLEDNADDAHVVLTSRGLVRRLEQRCPDLDAATSRYAGLAQECFLAGHYQAAAVLLGVASEAALQRLAASVDKAQPTLGVKLRRRGDSAASTLDWLEDVFRSRKKEIKGALDAASADSRWVHDLPRLLGPGTAIRLTRNAAGHPTDAAIDRGDAFRLFVLFPQMAEAIYMTAEALDHLPT